MKRLITRSAGRCLQQIGFGVFVAGLLVAGPAKGQTDAAPVFLTNSPAAPAESSSTNAPGWITQPLSLVDALNIALRQNATILKARNDVEISHGVVVETRAIAIPKVQVTGNFTSDDPNLIEPIPGIGVSFPHQNWTTGIELVQSIYQGGRTLSALRAAKLTQEKAFYEYQTVVADTLLATRIAYDDVLVATQQIVVAEASVNLLGKELSDQQRRYNAGTVPRFNVLRAEVAVANQRPNLIRARNNYRIAKNNLANLLGYDLPRSIWEDIPLNLTGKLEAQPINVDLPAAIQEALRSRSELGALRKGEQLQRENIVNAKAGYKPSLDAFAGYEWMSSRYYKDLSDEVNGWTVGARLNWNIFDGLATHGRVLQAEAQHDKSKTELLDESRKIELEVRTAYSTFIEAKEVLASQEKVQEEAEEALRLANARAEAGTGTQLDVLDAETSLTQARTTRIQALHDYAVARARLERAVGQNMIIANAPEDNKSRQK